MRFASMAALVLAAAFCTFGLARGDEKVGVDPANVGPGDVDITLTVKPDNHFAVADRVLATDQLKSFFEQQQKAHRVRYVLVTGDKVTVGDLIAVARVGSDLHFTVLFESKGQLKTMRLMK